MIPILTAYSNILTSKMKNLHENTIGSYINPAIGIFSLSIILCKWEFKELNKIIKELDFLNWFLIFLIALF